MLDHDEFARWLEASDDEARLASDLVGLSAFNAVVLHSEQAAQLVLKGLLRGVGAAREAWGHALPELASRAGDAAGLTLPDDLLERLKVLERDYKPSRYPDSLVSGTPRGNYGSADAERALATFARLRESVTSTWDRLVAEESGRDEPRGDRS
ncbi:HEPN domain-containing protein [soil metagenome]